MNAIIGDNGIITRAQEANIQSSIASLEEFLQLKYTENYEEMSKYQSKIEYYDEFLYAIERHSHDTDDIQERQMYERFAQRIEELTPKEDKE